MVIEKKISSAQLVVLLVMSRVPFATAYFVGLGDDHSVQDVLPAMPVSFAINFLTAIPLLFLMKLYPGKDPVECARLSLGKAGGYVAAAFYALCFILVASYDVSAFDVYFRNSVMPEMGQMAVLIPMCIVVFYAAIKGIETLGRFGSVVITVYTIVFLSIMGSFASEINPGYLTPLFYDGPSVFLKSLLNGVISNVQIVYLAFCAPFLRKEAKPIRIFAWWNVISSLMIFLAEFTAVIVMGPFAGKQNVPMSALAIQSRVGVFERVDSLDIIAWIFETAFMAAFEIFLSVRCSDKIRRGRFGKLAVLISTAAILFVGPVISKSFLLRRFITLSPVAAAIAAAAVIVVPSIMLICGKVKGGKAKNAQEA